MAKKASKPIRQRSSRADLDRLPQFEPDRIFRLDEHDSVLPFHESRARQIRDVLSSAMKDHVREASFQGEPTSIDRFLNNAMRAIAMYENQSLKSRAHDRKRAGKLVKEARAALLAFQRALEPIVEWKQLDGYLERFFVADRKQKTLQHEEREGRLLAALRDDLQPTHGHTVEWKKLDQYLKKPFAADRKLSVVGALRRQLKLGDQYRAQFRARSPRKLLEWLKFLEPLLSLSSQKLEFQAGDFQRNEIVRKFADDMVFAWMSATGAVPPISKSKRPSVFQRLLATINREILKPETMHRTDFRSPAVVAAERARKRYMGKNPSP
jgi:hypothetical protein